MGKPSSTSKAIDDANLGALYGVFYVGFKAGNKYATVKDAFAALKAGIK